MSNYDSFNENLYIRKTGSLLIHLLFYAFSLEFLFAHDPLWVTGYLPSYYQSEDGSIYFLTNSDYSKLTHISHHGPYIKQDGSFSYSETAFSDIKALKAVELAHLHNIPILLCTVAWYDYYIEAINDSISRNKVIGNILNLVDRAGYDGVDVDFEPVMSEYIGPIQRDNPHYIDFINQLYDSLQVRTSSLDGRPLLLTAAMNGYAGPVFARLYEKFDQINIMTYDMAAPDWGYPVWHDSPVYSDGFMVYGRIAPSVDLETGECLSAGVPPEKIGIGISCDAFRWKGGSGTSTGGATKPRQYWQTAPSWTRFSYKDMMAGYYKQEYYRWDDGAKMSYLSIDRSDAKDDEFWSYNDEKSCKAKVDFVRQNELGGMFIWELGSGFIASNPVNNRLPQLNAIYEAATDLGNKCVSAPVHNFLLRNYPNPFNPSTTIDYQTPETGHVELSVYTILGQKIQTLANGNQPAGRYTVQWNADADCRISSGIFFCILQAGAEVRILKMIMLQ